MFGLKFPNPVGLAAGMDKDAVLVDEMASIGFGFVEIGTLTPEPQPGNPRPRLFRLKKDQALINRMGFNNKGLVKAGQKLKQRKSQIIVGGNIGKNKITPNQDAVNDYLRGFEELYNYVDYFAVNVSSPNTPDLRELQDKEPLKKILSALMERNQQMPVQKPVLLKIAPDLNENQLDDIIEIVLETGIAGIIATNTTISRSSLTSPNQIIEGIGPGGLSGKPLKEQSTQVISYLYQKSGGAFPIIGVGGIMQPDDALEKLKAGATLIQLYTGFVYEGPYLVKKINKKILKENI